MLKSRKKMLLSSIAMLLVALVALGSASFAWYISQRTVSAEESEFSAATAEGLVIKHLVTDDWGIKVDDLETAYGLSPATCSYSNIGTLVRAGGGVGTDFYDGALTNTLSEESGTLANGQVGSFLYDSFYVASSSSSTATVTLTLDASTVTGTYMNLLVFVDGTLKGAYTSDGSATKTGKVTSAQGAASVTVEEAGTTTGYSLTPLNDNTVASDISCPSKNSGNGAKIEILAFADGFNENCTNENANPTPVPVKFNFSKNV